MGNQLSFSHNQNNLEISCEQDELNLFNIDEISRSYMDYISSTKEEYDNIIFSLNNVKAIDSSSVAFLVRAHLNAKKNKKKLILKDIPSTLKKTLDFANLLKDFEVR